MPDFSIRSLTPDDQEWVARFILERWGAECVVGHGTIYYPRLLPGYAAFQAEERVGLVTYHLEAKQCEIVTINSTRPSTGVGTALIEAVKNMARQAGCARLWLVTTNDNLNALRFYQKRGFRLAALRPNAIEAARKLKPQIPLIGASGIPLKDELELEMNLDEDA